MQKFYELVVLLHPQTSKEDLAMLYTKIDSLLSDGKKQTDDMGLMQLEHPVGKNKLSQVHMISYHCELEGSKLESIKKELSITKGVVRYVFFSMWAKDIFFTYADVNKKFEKLIEEEEKKEAALEDENKEVVIEWENGEVTTQAKESPVIKAPKKKKELAVRKWYFNKALHASELSWKATKLLMFYITRFGEIKPRRYMGNTVRQQKKVREAIIRARELGVVAYTK